MGLVVEDIERVYLLGRCPECWGTSGECWAGDDGGAAGNAAKADFRVFHDMSAAG